MQFKILDDLNLHWILSVADLGGAPPPRVPKIFRFHAVFGKIWQNHMLAPPIPLWGVGAPPPPGEILDPPQPLKITCDKENSGNAKVEMENGKLFMATSHSCVLQVILGLTVLLVVIIFLGLPIYLILHVFFSAGDPRTDSITRLLRIYAVDRWEFTCHVRFCTAHR